MKRFKSILILMIGVSTFIGCEKEEPVILSNDVKQQNEEQVNNTDKYVVVENITDELKVSIKNWVKNYKLENLTKEKGIEFDFENPKLLNINDKGTKSIVLEQKKENGSSYCMSFILNDDFSLHNVFIIKQNIISNFVTEYDYFNTSYEMLFTVVVDTDNNTLETYSPSDKSINDLYDDTKECIKDAYTNHDWISDWLTVQTMFIPQTGVAIAAACLLENTGGIHDEF